MRSPRSARPPRGAVLASVLCTLAASDDRPSCTPAEVWALRSSNAWWRNWTCELAHVAPRRVALVAGALGFRGSAGDGGPAAAALLSAPSGLAAWPAARRLFLADTGGHAVRQVDLATGTISTVAGVLGSPSGPGLGPPQDPLRLLSPRGVAIDAAAQTLYIADTENHVIRSVALAAGSAGAEAPAAVVVAGTHGAAGAAGDGGPAVAAQLSGPRALAVDAAARRLYVADTNNHAVRCVDLVSGLISTTAGVLGSGGLAGDAVPAALAPLYFPYGVEVHAGAQRLYVAEPYNHAVRVVDLATGELTTLAGVLGAPGLSGDGGPAIAAHLHFPSGLALDPSAEQLFVADAGNDVIRMVDLSSGEVFTVVGAAGAGTLGRAGLAVDVQLRFPTAVAVDPAGLRLFVAEQGGHAVRAVELAARATAGALGTLGDAGFEGPGGAQLRSPRAVAVDDGRWVYAADTSNHVVRALNFSTGEVTTVAGVPGARGCGAEPAAQGLLPLAGLAGSAAGFPLAGARYLWSQGGRGAPLAHNASVLAGRPEEPAIEVGGAPGQTYLDQPSGLALDVTTSELYVADTGNHAVHRVHLPTGALAAVAGSPCTPGASGDGGPATAAQLRSPQGLALDAAGGALYVADAGNHAIRLLDVASGTLSTAAGVLGRPGRAGDGGPAAAALLRSPCGVAVDAAAEVLFIADTYNHAVRVVDLRSGLLSTLAGVLGAPGTAGDGGPAASARLYYPRGLAVDAGAQRLYVADSWNHAVRALDLRTGLLTTVAGSLGSFGRVPTAGGTASGDGRADRELLHAPAGVAVAAGAFEAELFVADAGNHVVRMVALVNNVSMLELG